MIQAPCLRVDPALVGLRRPAWPVLYVCLCCVASLLAGGPAAADARVRRADVEPGEGVQDAGGLQGEQAYTMQDTAIDIADYVEG
jgi:hypothetical protein